VKAHAPFHRSYELAENLCNSAKRAREKTNGQRGMESGCWLDWHVGSTRPSDTVEELRGREYRGGDFTMRPYPLNGFDDRKYSWNWFDTELLGPGRTGTVAQGFRGAQRWKASRSRVKRLDTLVHEGADSIKRQIAAWNAIERGVQLPAGLPDGGFIGTQTPLRDAIELVDLHVRLEPDPRMPSPHTAGGEEKPR
jgi:hypothetical protein